MSIAAAALPGAANLQIFLRLTWVEFRSAAVVTRCNGWHRRIEMLDAIMLAVGVAFFALAIAYVTACDRM
jgi:hypothetical protein